MKGLLLSILFFLPALPLHITSAAYTPAQYSTDSSNNSDDPLIVDLGYAKYQGVLNETSNNVRFLGVHYAKSTAGQLRWKAPQAPDPLSDSKSEVQVLVADKQPAECPQAAGGLAPSSPFQTENASTSLNENQPELLKRDECDNVPTQDEDCLSLNVFVPGSQFNKTNTDCEEDEESLPVIIWIHGGGYHAGSASNPNLPNTTGTYNGEDLLNHLRADAGKEVGAGGDLNVGLFDQQFALQWNLSKMSSNVLMTTVSVFSGVDFNIWADILLSWLQATGLSSVLGSDRPSDATVSSVSPLSAEDTVAQAEAITAALKKQADWDQKNDKAIGSIKLRLSPAIRQKTLGMTSAKEIWTTLKNTYGKPGVSAVYTDFKRATSITIPNDANPSATIELICMHFDRVSAAGISTDTTDSTTPNVSITKIPNFLIVMFIISKLPPRYES
ncbi:hypothetical protein D9758_011359 [Tetrapyrgos nigripes]|uniref:Carboxylesterase type B domain-containing protein n=1 Tax=Tetrapyrgos nigripes TaxID=182062 RepID=A0A8H5G896_9AGAR|nr:hypothetical protein D9758_011359 [Tetrapyrgos nigripes]